MKREDLLKEMKLSVGTQAPLLFFEKMIDVFQMLFDRLDHLEAGLNRVKTHSALAIQWEPKVASDMLSKQIAALKQADKDTYAIEIIALQKAYAEDVITQEYASFCQFWLDTLGWHPFLDYAE